MVFIVLNVGTVNTLVDAVPLSNDGYGYWCCCMNEGLTIDVAV